MEKPKYEMTKNPYFLMPILVFFWGSFAAINKLLLKNLDSYQVLFFINGLAALIYSLFLFGRVKWRELRAWKPKDYILLLFCGLFAFLYDFLYIKALELLPATEASMLNYLFPIFIVLFAIPINNERLDVYKTLSIGLGFTGTVLLITKGNLTSISFTNLAGDVMAILAAVCWGLFTNLTKRNTKDMVMSNIFITYVGFILSICSLFIFSQYKSPTLIDFSGLIWLSATNMVLGLFIYIRALKYASASLVASFTYLTPFITILFIVFLVGERLTIIDFVAFVLICLGVPIQNIGKLSLRLSRKKA